LTPPSLRRNGVYVTRRDPPFTDLPTVNGKKFYMVGVLSPSMPTVNLYVSERAYREILRRAEASGRSVGAVTRELIMRALELPGVLAEEEASKRGTA